MALLRYLLLRIIQSVLLLFLVSIITFVLVNKAPGLPEIVADLDITEEEQDRMIRNLGLDLPIHVQYLDWAEGVIHGDIGNSYLSGRPVIDLIKKALPASIKLAGASLIIAIIISIPVGIFSALKRYSILDYLVTAFSFIGASIPGFWYALLLILLFGVTLGWLPTSGSHPIGEEVTFFNSIPHFIMPSLVLSTAAMAQLTRYTRSSMIEILRKDFIRTAHAKGLQAKIVVLRHALINSLFPIITVVALLIPSLIGGAAIVELVFAWPGIGRLAIDSALKRDYPTVMGITLLISAITIFSNLAIDVAYVFLDPRLRAEDL
jgi:peptide/nickel transport system permease protein